MKKTIPLEKAHLLINHGPIAMITCFDGKKGNIMTVAWTTPINSEPPLVGVVIGEQAYSYSVIKKTREFAVNIPSAKLLRKAVQCGNSSGKEVDKFRKFGLTELLGEKIKAPLIKECIAHLECRVYSMHKFADATLFVGRVQLALVEEGLFDTYLRVDKVKGRTLHHLGGSNFAVPGKILKAR
jgi:flavin reductase (DIM6/NTAB) family NADH-FMN oxidoreductase RutF